MFYSILIQEDRCGLEVSGLIIRQHSEYSLVNDSSGALNCARQGKKLLSFLAAVMSDEKILLTSYFIHTLINAMQKIPYRNMLIKKF